MSLNPGQGDWTPLCYYWGTHFLPKISKRLLRLILLSPEQGFSHIRDLRDTKCLLQMPSCCLWLPWHPCLPSYALSNQFTCWYKLLSSKSHDKQPWDTQGNERHEPKLLKSIFKAANESAQPSPKREKKEKGLNSRSCKKMWAYQQMEDFLMRFTTFPWHKSWGQCSIYPSHPLFLLLRRRIGPLVSRAPQCRAQTSRTTVLFKQWFPKCPSWPVLSNPLLLRNL